MAPVRTYSSWNKRPSDYSPKIEPYRKYFIICEGANTEVWYFKKLIDLRKYLDIHPLIDLRLMEKTEKHKNLSNPKPLIQFAEAQKALPEIGFDVKRDKMIIVFDADIYKYKSDKYAEILTMKQSNDIFAVTYPSFELFLILHYENAYERIIKPNVNAILENRKEGKRRFVAKLFTDQSGQNPKENSSIAELAKDVRTAIQEAKHLNQDIENAVGQLTSNVGKVIQDILDDKG